MRCIQFFCSSPTSSHSDWGQQVQEAVTKSFERGLADVGLPVRGKVEKNITPSCPTFWLSNEWLFHLEWADLRYLLLDVLGLMSPSCLQRLLWFLFLAYYCQSKFSPINFSFAIRADILSPPLKLASCKCTNNKHWQLANFNGSENHGGRVDG